MHTHTFGDREAARQYSTLLKRTRKGGGGKRSSTERRNRVVQSGTAIARRSSPSPHPPCAWNAPPSCAHPTSDFYQINTRGPLATPLSTFSLLPIHPSNPLHNWTTYRRFLIPSRYPYVSDQKLGIFLQKRYLLHFDLSIVYKISFLLLIFSSTTIVPSFVKTAIKNWVKGSRRCQISDGQAPLSRRASWWTRGSERKRKRRRWWWWEGRRGESDWRRPNVHVLIASGGGSRPSGVGRKRREGGAGRCRTQLALYH